MKVAAGPLRLPLTAALATGLSSICLGSAFLTGSWFLPAMFAIVFVLLGTELARRMSAPPVIVPLVGVLTLTGYLVARYAHSEAFLWIIPDRSALHRLAELGSQGNDQISHYAAPVAVTPGLELLAVAGIGFVALAVDTLAVTLRRAALAGLPLLALYTVPASVSPEGVSWEAFALGGAGYLALLLAESRERLSRWGRPLRFSATRTDWQADVETAPLAQVGRRVGAAALGLALVVPALMPTLGVGSFGLGGPGLGLGRGGNKVAVINPIIDLGQDLRQDRNRQVIRYEGTPTYLRMVGLDVFTGDTWRPSEISAPKRQNVENGLPNPPGLTNQVTRKRQRHKIEVFDLEQQFLPLPYPAQRVSINGRWVYDTATFNVFSVNSSTRRLTYQVTDLALGPTPAQLRAAPDAPASLDRFLQLPLGIPAEVQRIAKQIVGKAPTHYDEALALQDWLRDPTEFTYSTDVADSVGDANGARAIAAFLDTRRGYCVHFASTMAVMARQLGIPARVAVGFTAGTRDAKGRMVVTLHDAHSWPELYFEGAGWVAFEPTPGSRTGSPPPWARAAVAPIGGGSDATAVPTPAATGGTGVNPRVRAPESFNNAKKATSGSQSVFQRLNLPKVPTVVVLIALLAGLVPSATRLVVRRRRWRGARTPADTVAAAWAELRDTLVDYGYLWRPSDSPRRGAARVSEEMALTGASDQAVRRLGAATERARYATTLGEVGDLRADVETVRAALGDATTSWGRARARWLPRSTREVAAASSERMADGFDAVDDVVATVRERVFSGRSRRGGGSTAPRPAP